MFVLYFCHTRRNIFLFDFFNDGQLCFLRSASEVIDSYIFSFYFVMDTWNFLILYLF